MNRKLGRYRCGWLALRKSVEGDPNIAMMIRSLCDEIVPPLDEDFVIALTAKERQFWGRLPVQFALPSMCRHGHVCKAQREVVCV